MRKIIYLRPDGRTCVVNPAMNSVEAPDFTEADAEARAMAKIPPSAINPHFVDESAIPADRTFRNAWNADLTVDMPKAREIHKETLRKLRAPILEQAAGDYTNADIAKDEAKKTELAAKITALRDVTDDPAIAAAQTPEQLKAAIPDVLK